MSAIAARYGIPLDELQALNPGISATIMSIGTVLHIPSIPENPGGDSTPTPAPVSVEQVACYPTLDGGLWCFILVHNDAVQSLENVSAQVTVLDAGGVQIASQTALLPLNILEPNARLPLTTFFAPQIPARAHAQVQILTAMPVMADDGRYLPAEIRNTLVEVNWLGHSAMVSGQVFLPAGSGAAAQIWVAAAAYDRAGRVVGVRRWENNEALAGGDAMEFTFMVSSQAGGIGRVELAVEARP
jgi:LysM repeat protein